MRCLRRAFNHLGSYFCIPLRKPRATGEEQCAGTRPGLAPMASAMAVELLMALLHHPLGADAPTPTPAWRGGGRAAEGAGTFSPGLGEGGYRSMPSLPLGSSPHQIRGLLVYYTMMTPTVPDFW